MDAVRKGLVPGRKAAALVSIKPINGEIRQCIEVSMDLVTEFNLSIVSSVPFLNSG